MDDLLDKLAKSQIISDASIEKASPAVSPVTPSGATAPHRHRRLLLTFLTANIKNI